MQIHQSIPPYVLHHQLLAELNDVQRAAVCATEGPVLILAGAGSGKTNVLTRRIAYLIAEKKVSPFTILAVTFTNKAANEMRERVERHAGESGRKIWIGTFHSIFGRILRMEGEKIGYTPHYTIYDADDQLNLIKLVMEAMNVSTELYPPSMVRHLISSAKNRFQSPVQLGEKAESPVEEKAAVVFAEYEKRLKKANAFDFDDLIVKAIELFRQREDVLEFYQDKFRYIHIDEYQDTNKAQYLLMRMLAKKHQNICVVGDDDQSIYGWRSADIGNILNFEKDYSGTRTFKLEQNYRSTQNILRVASEVVKNNRWRKDKTLWTRHAAGNPVIVMECEDDRLEASSIVDTVVDLIHKEKRKFSDFAVLYRTNAQSRVLEDALRQQGLPYVIVGGVRFYERKEIKDILAYLRVIANPSDTVSLKRVINTPPRGIGKTTLDRLDQFAEATDSTLFDALGKVRTLGTGLLQERAIQNVELFYQQMQKYIELKNSLSLGEWVRILVEDIGVLRIYKQENTVESISRYENVVEFITAISEFALTHVPETEDETLLDAFLKEVTLMTDIDQVDDKKNAITLMTIHSSKGLEFPVVFVAGVEEGLFPLENASGSDRELEEERRLFYVSATRAEKDLYVSFAKRRMRFNTVYRTTQSRFVDEMPKDIVLWKKHNRPVREEEYLDQVTSRRTRSSRTRPQGKNLAERSEETVARAMKQEQTFDVGQQVLHATFGAGRIVHSEGLGDKQKVTIRFDDGSERKLMVKFANLMIR